ncbi:hypothetical protein PMAYCL1PPCAC_32173, partial [Pristionchus mayeri]
NSRCTEHHIVIVIGGYETINLASVLFKSILFHHRGPLFFHFIADGRSRKVLPTLFDTWKIPSVRYQMYDMERFEKDIEWIRSNHYSSKYGLIRLAIPDILPKEVKEVLFLDTDLVVLNDITPIFDAFKGANDSVLFAMAENISPWYSKKYKHHWPARGRGFNAGVMLMHTERMRKANWSEMWKNEARERLKRFSTGHDQVQDILNALTISYPHIVVELPCEYNLQLGEQSLPAECTIEDRIAHFNSKQKMRWPSKYVAHFARYFAVYQSMDGYTLRAREQCDVQLRTRIVQEHNSLADLDDSKEPANVLMETSYRTHLYFNGFESSKDSGEVTLVTQLPFEHFHEFQKLVGGWEGPISAAIYCTDAELSQIEKLIATAHAFRRRTNVVLHAVFKIG